MYHQKHKQNTAQALHVDLSSVFDVIFNCSILCDAEFQTFMENKHSMLKYTCSIYCTLFFTTYTRTNTDYLQKFMLDGTLSPFLLTS